MLSIILSALGFGGMVFGLSEFGGGHGGEGRVHDGSGALPWCLLAVGVIGLVLFVLRQFALQRKDDALLDLRVFTSGNFTVSVVIMAVVALAMLGTF